MSHGQRAFRSAAAAGVRGWASEGPPSPAVAADLRAGDSPPTGHAGRDTSSRRCAPSSFPIVRPQLPHRSGRTGVAVVRVISLAAESRVPAISMPLSSPKCSNVLPRKWLGAKINPPSRPAASVDFVITVDFLRTSGVPDRLSSTRLDRARRGLRLRREGRLNGVFSPDQSRVAMELQRLVPALGQNGNLYGSDRKPSRVSTRSPRVPRPHDAAAPFLSSQ